MSEHIAALKLFLQSLQNRSKWILPLCKKKNLNKNTKVGLMGRHEVSMHDRKLPHTLVKKKQKTSVPIKGHIFVPLPKQEDKLQLKTEENAHCFLR